MSNTTCTICKPRSQFCSERLPTSYAPLRFRHYLIKKHIWVFGIEVKGSFPSKSFSESYLLPLMKEMQAINSVNDLVLIKGRICFIFIFEISLAYIKSSTLLSEMGDLRSQKRTHFLLHHHSKLLGGVPSFRQFLKTKGNRWIETFPNLRTVHSSITCYQHSTWTHLSTSF